MPTTTNFLAEDISVERLLKSVAYLWRVLYGEKDSKNLMGNIQYRCGRMATCAKEHEKLQLN